MIFVGIIGERNSGKSSLIQSITGCQSASYRGLTFGFSDQSIYVCASSPQESKFDYGSVSDLDAVRAVLRDMKRKRGCRGVIMAIWPNRPRSRPSMEEIYTEVAAQGYDAIYGFPLDPGYQPKSSIYSNVSERLDTLNPEIDVCRLRGYQFPLVNATKVNQISNLVF